MTNADTDRAGQKEATNTALCIKDDPAEPELRVFRILCVNTTPHQSA
jgi:hypothetical protein